jgi:hypothetical protein
MLSSTGNLGAPLPLQETIDEIVPVHRTLLGDTRVPLIDVVHQFSAKLQAYTNRRNGGGYNDYNDLMFLIQIYHQTVGINRFNFDEALKATFYLDAAVMDPELADWLQDVLF